MADLAEMKTLENKGYSFVMLNAMMLVHKEAAEQGLLAEAEDLVDAALMSIASQVKRRYKVWGMNGEELTAEEALREAQAIQPPPSVVGAERHRHPKNRDRVLRKIQIMTDLDYKMAILNKDVPVGRQYTGDSGPPEVEFNTGD
jgi:hypothetical protein